MLKHKSPWPATGHPHKGMCDCLLCAAKHIHPIRNTLEHNKISCTYVLHIVHKCSIILYLINFLFIHCEHRSSPFLNLMANRIKLRVTIIRRQTSTAMITARIMVGVSDDAMGLHGSICSEMNEIPI